MSYIVQRKDRFYVVAYDGLDPLTGKERRRWHPAGHDRTEAERLVARLDEERLSDLPSPPGPISLGGFLASTWLPIKRRQVRSTTAYRYAWFIDRYINPAIGDISLRRLRSDHLDTFYDDLAATGGRNGDGVAPKTVHEVHAIIRACARHRRRTQARQRQRRPPHPTAPTPDTERRRRGSGPRTNSAASSAPHENNVSTRHSTSLLTPG